ncbi:MAG: hypothetical protein BWY31_04041 [Lentisphaerae bacterium ADurb.Bin242]|nr:MAG: hypothetical protein BWY31_04041 [Lentisphaerae bacterium ADurb.Bin242]
MKKTWIAALCFAGSLFALTAGEEVLDINGNMSGEEGKIPTGWAQNVSPYFKPLGKIEVVKADAAAAVKITSTPEKPTDMFFKENFPAEAGDKVEIEAEIKGKGQAILGIYGKDGAKWGPTQRQNFKATDTFTPIKATVTVQNSAVTVKSVQVFLSAGVNHEITFRNVKAKLITK